MDAYVGDLGRYHLWSPAGLGGFQLTGGPCSVLARDCAMCEFCPLIHHSQNQEELRDIWSLSEFSETTWKTCFQLGSFPEIPGRIVSSSLEEI